MGVLRLGFVIAVLAVVTFVMMPFQRLAMRRNWPVAQRIPQRWQQIARRLIGMRVTVVGSPARPPLLILSNHVSWLDITALGSVLPVSFIAKSEVAGWPVFGTLARLQRTIFIDRTRRLKAGEAAAAIARRIGNGDNMVLFAEGTTGDGNAVLPFRSALLGAASAATGVPEITAQPVAIAYVRRGGLPIGRPDRPAIAWYGAMDLVPHFSGIVAHGPVDVVIAFGEALRLGPDQDRKRVAETCFAAVRAMLAELRRNPALSNGHASPIFSAGSKGGKGTASEGGAVGAAEPTATHRVS
jgi:1-acyl-sn-glycerol-3-phosphate acyltransferase